MRRCNEILKSRVKAAALLYAFCMAVGCQSSFSQPFPAKPVRILLGISPGGSADALARTLASELTKAWGQTVVVENRPGASDLIAGEAMVRSPADGYTLFQTHSGTLMTNQFLRKKIPFDPVNDLAIAVALAQASDYLVARARLPANNVQELVSLAKAKPETLNYGSFGIGSAIHLDAEWLGMLSGAKFTHVPYKGGGDVNNALLAEEIDFAFNGPSIVPLVNQGRLKALAFGGRERSPVLPNVPTLRESGYDFDTGGWYGWYVPAGTPRAIVEKIATDTIRALSTREIHDKVIAPFGFEVLALPAAAANKLLGETREKYSGLFRKIDIKIE